MACADARVRARAFGDGVEEQGDGQHGGNRDRSVGRGLGSLFPLTTSCARTNLSETRRTSPIFSRATLDRFLRFGHSRGDLWQHFLFMSNREP